VIDQRPELLEFVDREIVDNLVFHMREARGKFRLGEKVVLPSVIVPTPATRFD
jgi:hypothetical protein